MKDTIIEKMRIIATLIEHNFPMIATAMGYIVVFACIFIFSSPLFIALSAFYNTIMLVISSTSPGIIALALSFVLLTYASIPTPNRATHHVLAPLAIVLLMLAILPSFIAVTPAFASIIVLYVTCSTLLGFKYPYVNILNMLIFTSIAAALILPTVFAPAIVATSTTAVFSAPASGLWALASLSSLIQACFTCATIVFAINNLPDSSLKNELSPKDTQFQIALVLTTLEISVGIAAIFLGSSVMVYAHLISSMLVMLAIGFGENDTLFGNPTLLFFAIIFILPAFSLTITPQILGLCGALTLNVKWALTEPNGGILDMDNTLNTTPTIDPYEHDPCHSDDNDPYEHDPCHSDDNDPNPKFYIHPDNPQELLLPYKDRSADEKLEDEARAIQSYRDAP